MDEAHADRPQRTQSVATASRAHGVAGAMRRTTARSIIRVWAAPACAVTALGMPALAGASIARVASLEAVSGGVAAVAQTPARATRTPAATGSACAGRVVAHLRLRRLARMRARLSWRAPSAAASAAAASSAGVVYRVLRAGATVGQTRTDWIELAVTPGRRTTFTVQARYAGGAQTCSARTTMVVPVRLPARVRGLRVISRTASQVVVGWRGARSGDAPIVGYRVSLDGAVAGQTRTRRYTLILSAARAHRVRVVAVDTRERVGAPSRELLISPDRAAIAKGAPPSTPEGLGAAEVSETGATVWWLASRAGGASLAGYRVYRDGALVGQSTATSLHLTRLSSGHEYAITVSAVDADGSESARSAALELSTAHTAPSAPAGLSAVRVSDTSATLSWQAGSATSGSVAGYLLFENGEPVGVVQGTIVTVTLASQRTYTFTVRTMDTLGYLSASSSELTVLTTHTPPARPAGLAASSVTSHSSRLIWSPSVAVSGTIVGYRVFRNEVVVGQTSSTELEVEGLAPSSEYTFTVSAVDSLGAVSEPSAPLLLQTAPPNPTHGSVQAYVLASTDGSFEDLESHYEQVGVVYPTYYECGPEGAITGHDDPLITGWALARKIEVLPRVNCLNVAYEQSVLNDPSARQRTIEALAALCRAHGYSGIQIDFEDAPPAARRPFTAFITALAARLHSQGDKLSTVVTAKYWNVPTGRAAMYDDAALSVPSDYIFVLDWGYHWVTSTPGSIDEFGWFKRVAEYTATLPNLAKFTLGMPMYGVDWPSGGGPEHPGTALEYSAVVGLAASLGITPEWEATAQSPHFSYTDPEGVAHEVWYVDRQSVSARAALASSLGMQVGLWRLGEEDPGIWELPQLGGKG